MLISTFNVTGGDAALFERLRTTAGVLVLDNCEHVIDAAATIATRVLDARARDADPLYEPGPSRHRRRGALRTGAARPRRCDRPVHQARRARRRQRAADDAEAVEELCRSLDGLPLAIELAAARTKTLPIDEITRRLDDRFSVLHDPTSRKPERRRALRATIGWSYELLFPDDKRGLWALAAFSGGASLPAVEFVLEAGLDVPSTAALDVVGRLAARSLVIIDDVNTALTFRYRLLDSIRAFALEAATEAGCAKPAMAAHARWFADAASTSTEGVRSRHQGDHLALARNERANIDAALAWSAANDPFSRWKS